MSCLSLFVKLKKDPENGKMFRLISSCLTFQQILAHFSATKLQIGESWNDKDTLNFRRPTTQNHNLRVNLSTPERKTHFVKNSSRFTKLNLVPIIAMKKKWCGKIPRFFVLMFKLDD